MNKIYLVIWKKENKKSFIKYFDCEYNKNKMKNKIKYSKKLFIIEDSSDIKYSYENDDYEN